MGTKLKVVLVLSAVTILGFTVRSIVGHEEPAYQGQRLKVWLLQYVNSRGEDIYPNPRTIRADTAIRSIGSNALPYLVNSIAERDWPECFGDLLIHWNAGAVAAHHGLWKQYNRYVLDDWLLKPCNDRLLAEYGFIVLGHTAKPAVPALIKLLDDKDLHVRSTAASCLYVIGPDAEPAVPALKRHATNDPSDWVRSECGSTLLQIESTLSPPAFQTPAFSFPFCEAWCKY